MAGRGLCREGEDGKANKRLKGFSIKFPKKDQTVEEKSKRERRLLK